MCRVLAYLGQPVPLDDLLYNADGSLVAQAYAPKMLRMVNLAGFGMAAWGPASRQPAELACATAAPATCAATMTAINMSTVSGTRGGTLPAHARRRPPLAI